MIQRDVMLAFPHPGSVKTEFMLSCFDACSAEGSRIGELRDFRTGPAMAQARNMVTKIFLESSFEWLWMVDSDMVFSARTLPALLAVADPETMPVVGGLCFVQLGPDHGEQACTMFSAIRDENGKFTFKSFDRFPLDQPVRVAATGAACLLIHREVFVKMMKQDPDIYGLWWADITADGSLFGEDFSFCMRCAQADIPVHVHTGVEVGHTKSTIIGRVKP